MESEKEPMESEPKEPVIEFTDKRRVHLDADAPAATEPPEIPEVPEVPEIPEIPPVEPSDRPAPADEDTATQMPEMDVYGLLQTTVGLLANGARAWMGLTPNPFTGEMSRDLAQAKVAIDTVAFLVGQLDPKLSPEERRELQNLVSMLRINYVQQTQQT